MLNHKKPFSLEITLKLLLDLAIQHSLSQELLQFLMR